MSRLAKKPILFPAGVTATLDGSMLVLQGPKGKLDYTIPATVTATLENNTLLLRSTAVERKDHAQWGLSWALIQSRMQGVAGEFKKTLEIQ